MPDISAKASHDYWKQYHDPIIARVLCGMESVESPKDNNVLFNILLKELGKTLDQLDHVDLNQLSQREHFIRLANQLNMSQTLRLLQALDNAQPGSASQLLMLAEQTTRQLDDDSGIFLQRNLIFERLRLLSRVFSKERLDLVHSALQHE